MIYINGFAYGKQYSINKDTMAIILNDFETTKHLSQSYRTILEQML